MIDRILLRSQKNEIFKVLGEQGLDPYISGFVWTEIEWRKEYQGKFRVSVLNYNIDGETMDFRFAAGDEYWYPSYYPGIENRRAYLNQIYNWESVVQQFRSWCKLIKVELDSPNLWSEVASIQKQFLLDSDEAINNDPISAKEGRVLRHNIERLREELISNFASSNEQKNLILNKMQYLEDAIERQGKTDWIHTAVGVFVSVAMSLGVSAAEGDRFWQIVKDIFGAPFRLLLG